MTANLSEVLKLNLTKHLETSDNLVELIVGDNVQISLITMKERKNLELWKQKGDIFEELQTASMKRSAAKVNLRLKSFTNDPKCERNRLFASVVQCICNKIEKLFKDAIKLNLRFISLCSEICVKEI